MCACTIWAQNYVQGLYRVNIGPSRQLTSFIVPNARRLHCNFHQLYSVRNTETESFVKCGSVTPKPWADAEGEYLSLGFTDNSQFHFVDSLFAL